jgi:hypothetical protein
MRWAINEIKSSSDLNSELTRMSHGRCLFTLPSEWQLHVCGNRLTSSRNDWRSVAKQVDF